MSFETLIASIAVVFFGACAWLAYVLVDRWRTRRREMKRLAETFVNRYGRQG